MCSPGLSGKPKHRFSGMKLGSVTKLSLVTAPIQGGVWTQVLCGQWKIPMACVRKGVTDWHKPFHLVIPEGLGKARQSPGSPSTRHHIVTTQRSQQEGPRA